MTTAFRTIQNLTPHDVVLLVGNTKVVIPPSGQVARVKQSLNTSVLSEIPVEINGELVNLIVDVPTFGEVADLPPFDGTVLKIVSSIVRSACPARTDLITPNTIQECVREGNEILGVKRFLANV